MELPVLQNFFYSDAPFWPPNLPTLAAWYDTTRGVYSDGGAHFTAASSQYLSAASNADFNLSTVDFTLEGAFFLDSTGQMAIACKYQDANNYWRLELDAANKLHFIAVIGGSTLIDVQGTTAVTTASTWYGFSLVVDRDSTANTKIYLNATNDTAGTPTVSASSIDNTGAINIGRCGSATLYFNGRLDSLHCWKTARSSSDVTSWYNAGAFRVYADNTTTTGLAYWWDLKEETGTRYDAHGTNHLTTSNTVLISPPTFGSELITNGTFDSATTGWTASVSTLASVAGGESGNCLQITNVGANYGSAGQSFTTVAGTVYQVRFWHKNGTTTGSVNIGTANHSGDISVGPQLNDTSATVRTIRFTATGTTTWITLFNYTNTDTQTTLFDGISVKAVTALGLLNGGFELPGAGGADVFANWTEQVAGTSTVNDETAAPYAGSHACRFDIDASNSAYIVKTGILRIGDRYQVSIWAKTDAAGGKLTAGDGYTYPINLASLTTSYEKYTYSYNALYTQQQIMGSGASRSVTIDDIEIKDLGPVGIAGIAAGAATDGNFCGQFNGTTQSLSVASNSTLQTGNIDWWMSAWAYLDSGPTYKMILEKNDTGKYEYTVLFDSAGKPSINVYAVDGSAQDTATWGTAGVVGQWYHVVAGLDSVNNKVFIIVNGGTPVLATRAATLTASTAAVYIGNYPLSASYGFAGRIDSVVFGKNPPGGIFALYSTIASTLYNSGKGIKPSALTTTQKTAWGVVSGWDLDKKAGITVDSVGTNTLTNNNAVTYAQGVDYYEGVVSKILDQSVNVKHATQTTNSKRPAYITSFQNSKAMVLFDGVDDMLSFTAASLGTTNSVFVVVKPVALLGVVVGGGVGTYAFYITGSGVVYSVGGAFVSATHGMSAGTAYILGVVRDGTSVQFYKNGSTLGTVQTLSANTALAVDTLGANTSGANPYSGYLADPLLYSTALNPTQVANVFSVLNAKYQVF